jgi:hypothetical protein
LNNACPSCGAVYSVQPQHVGRRLSCKKCGTPLAVDADGIHLATADPPVEAALVEPPSTPGLAVDDRELSPARLAGSRPSSSPPVWPRVSEGIGRVFTVADVPTLLFGVGVVLLLMFFFLPLIDQARLAGHRAALSTGELRAARREREWKDQKDVDETQRQRTRDSWTKEKTRLEEQIEESTISAARALPTYRYGLLAASLILAVASLLYLRPSQPTIRRVVGAVVLLAEILLILLVVFVEGSVSRG